MLKHLGLPTDRSSHLSHLASSLSHGHHRSDTTSPKEREDMYGIGSPYDRDAEFALDDIGATFHRRGLTKHGSSALPPKRSGERGARHGVPSVSQSLQALMNPSPPTHKRGSRNSSRNTSPRIRDPMLNPTS